MGLVDHAKTELEISGYGGDYDGMIGDAVIELIETFANQGHSGFSAYKTAALFERLARFEPLTPLTDNPKEWERIGKELGFPETVWQNRRDSSAFSTDGGKTYYLLDDPGTILTSESHTAND